MATSTYDPRNVSVVVGTIMVNGFASGSMVKCERNNDTYSLEVGGDGYGVRSRNPNRSGKITIRLLQSSATNISLTAMAASDELLGEGIVTVTVADLNGKTLWSSPEAWVLKPPSSDHQDKASDREWVLECTDLEFFEGGI